MNLHCLIGIKTLLFKEGGFEAYIYPLEYDFFGYQYYHVELIPYDNKMYFSPDITRNFNVYVKRDYELTVTETLERFEKRLNEAVKAR